MNTGMDSQPKDRLTRMGDVMTEAFRDHPEWQAGDRCIAVLSGGEMGGIAICDYEDVHDAFDDMLHHLHAMAEALGLKMDIIGVPDSPEGLES